MENGLNMDIGDKENYLKCSVKEIVRPCYQHPPESRAAPTPTSFTVEIGDRNSQILGQTTWIAVHFKGMPLTVANGIGRSLAEA
ncbi:hypothetical protein H920_10892 [Fukomys damarensis]|uniref:Uncharacterized protein n=1 Tax=Fukomys damarensis TaxID=885580 RepID=A0A091D9J2_FUKDA|nr:hypothetical protein H920_10892 [Fukomys damarensis]